MSDIDLKHLTRNFETRFANVERRLDSLESKISSTNQYGFGEPTAGSHSLVVRPEKKAVPLSHEFAENITAVVGLKEALTSEHRLTKLIWIGLFVFGIGATIFYLYETTDEYFKKPTATSVQLAESNRLAFPPLLLCPKIWFNAEKAADLGLSMNALKYSISYLSDSFSEDLADVKASRNEFLVLYALNGFRSLLDYYKAISPNLQYQTPNNTNLTSLYSCRGCEAAEVAEKTILDLRLCFVFNFTPVEIGFGTYSGDRLVKIKYATRTLNLARESLDWDLYFKPSTNAFISVFPKLTVRSSYYNTIKLSEQRHVMLPSEVAPCVDKEGYSAVDCMAKCHNDMYLALLNCGLLRLSQSLKHLPTDYCNYMDRYLSENLTLSEFFASEQNTRIDAAAADDCVRQCPPPCRRVIFDTTLQLQTRFSDNGEKTEEEEHETNSTRIEVHLKHAGIYQGGVMVLSEMITYTFTQWVNNVGGTLGLFVGATLMTFAQVVVFAINYTLGRVTGSESVSSMITVQK